MILRWNRAKTSALPETKKSKMTDLAPKINQNLKAALINGRAGLLYEMIPAMVRGTTTGILGRRSSELTRSRISGVACPSEYRLSKGA
jgi:hypothetical protein